MFDERLAGLGVARENVEHARRQTHFHRQLGKCERGERRIFCRLDDDRISRCQRRSDLPRKHQQRKIPRNDLANHAAGLVVGKLGFEKLRPACVVIKVPRDERNVDVAALADGLAVVHRFENGKTARMFLHLASESIEIPRALVAAERLPCGKSLARRGDGGFNVGGVALGDFGESFAGGGIAGGLVLAARWRDPRAANEFLKPAVVPIEPWVASFGSSGARRTPWCRTFPRCSLRLL